MTLAIEEEPEIERDADVTSDRIDVRMAIPPGETRRFIAGSYRWTLDDYHKIGLTGLFAHNRSALIQGVIYVSGMPSEPHSQGVLQVSRVVRRLFNETDWDVREEKGFVVPPDTNCGPDLAVVRRESSPPSQEPRTAQLIIEVAVSNLTADLGVMAELYAAAGVPLYLVLAPKRRSVYVFTEPRPNAMSTTGHRYASVVKLDVGQFVKLNDPASTSIRVAELLGIPSPP